MSLLNIFGRPCSLRSFYVYYYAIVHYMYFKSRFISNKVRYTEVLTDVVSQQLVNSRQRRNWDLKMKLKSTH